MEDWFFALKETVEKEGEAVLATVTESRGSVPRKTGARMIVGREGRIFGTIGGGLLEYQAEQTAKTVIQKKESCFGDCDLSGTQAAEEGMICGGTLRVHYQYLGKGMPDLEKTMEKLRQEYECALKSGKVYIFGGGHVSQALVPVLASVGFRCVVLEDREEFLQKELFPGAWEVRRVCNDRISETVKIREEDYVCILTRGHKDDMIIQAQVLQTKASYIGVIGSRRKAAAVAAALKEKYHISSEELKRVHTPIGLPIGAETPAEIAVSIAAELIRCRAGQLDKK